MSPDVHTRPNGRPAEPTPSASPDQQLHARAVPSSSNLPHRYRLWTLSLLCLGALFWELVAWMSLFVPEELFAAAMFVYLGVLGILFVLDWRHLFTLHGHIHWQELSWPARLGVVLLYAVLTVLFFSLPVLYLAFAVKDTLDERRASPDKRKLRTAQMEAELGILPGIEGECPRCHQPLQASAEYCMYCGVSVSHKPRVCPACAATASPDAQFCPYCRTPFVGPDSAASA